MIEANIFLPDIDEISTCHWDQCAKLQIDIRSFVSMIPPSHAMLLKASRESSFEGKIHYHRSPSEIILFHRLESSAAAVRFPKLYYPTIVNSLIPTVSYNREETCKSRRSLFLSSWQKNSVVRYDTSMPCSLEKSDVTFCYSNTA